MAWITKSDKGRWVARYRAPDGCTRSKTFDRKADAGRWLTTEQSRSDRGEWIDPRLGKVKFAEWAEQVLTARLNVGPATALTSPTR